MTEFRDLLDKISKISSINYKIRTYKEFQKDIFVRKAIIEIVKDKEYFTQLLFPSSNNLHIRILCPVCGLGRKRIDNLQIFVENYNLLIKEKCPVHGEYSSIVNYNNENYIDINTQFRDLTKGISFVENDKLNNTLTIMLDGADWSGTWAQRIHTEGMVRLGYTEFPIRLFTPMILDWSGAKFSKSLYLKNGAYKDINSACINYKTFLSEYGDVGINKLWNEVESWVHEPKKIFRNYSVDYFQMILEKQ